MRFLPGSQKIPADLRGQLAGTFRDDLVDFGQLDADQQTEVIRRAGADAGVRSRLLADNRVLATLLAGGGQRPRDELVAKNRDRVRQAYSPAACGRRLLAVYRQLLADRRDAAARPGAVDIRVILDRLLHPTRFQPLRIV